MNVKKIIRRFGAAALTAALLFVNIIPSFAESAGGQSTASEEVNIIMVGDMLMHMRVVNSGKQEDGSYDFSGLFDHVRDKVASADIALVNQETILGGPELGGYTGFPAFNSPYEVGDAEAGAGFDVILQGTNHALDKGAKGIENCLSFWEESHPEIPVLGIHDSAEDQKELCILEVKGIRFAILNYTYGTNGIQMPKGKGYLVDYLSKEKVTADIERAEKEADFTILCPHWGTEYSTGISAYQKDWAKLFLEKGVDLVIGTHPHVIEPIEYLTDEAGHEMLVYYSLGNFVNSTSGSGKGVMNRFVGGMADVTVKMEDGRARIARYTIHPTIGHLGGKKDITAYFLSDYTEELSKVNQARERDASFSLENCRKLVEKIWPDHE